jgi:DNA-directed RNA polymerase subunit RPC12/RpoP
VANEHFKSLLRQGQMATRDPRKVLGEVAESAQVQDSIQCPNCSNTLGVQPDLTTDNDPFAYIPGVSVYVTNADPLIDGEEDMNENGGKVVVCQYCGYDVTDVLEGFYGDKLKL